MNRNYILWLTLAWLGMQILLVSHYGIVTVNEAGKYINQADVLLETGTVSHPSMWLYSTEILLIAAAKALNTGFAFVVLIQVAVNGIATWTFYRFCRQEVSSLTALIISFLLVLNFSFQSFNTFLYTESLFFSLTLILSCYLFRLKAIKTGSIFWIFFLLLLLCFTRPSGLLIVPAVMVYVFTRFFRDWSFILKAVAITGITLLFLFILNLVMGSGGELDFMLPYREEHIICGVPTTTGNDFVNGNNSVLGIINYVVDHPGQAARLAWKRSLAFFGLTREYYSTGHNLYLAFYFYPIFLLAAYGITLWWKQNKAILAYCIAVVIITWASVMLTCDDWHNRFFLTTVPYIYILALPSLDKILNFLFKSKKEKSPE